MFEANKKHKAWREVVTRKAAAAKELTKGETIKGPAVLSVVFFMPRPATVKRLYPTPKPDLSKLVRSIEDSLVDAGLIIDDSYIVRLHADKVYAEETRPAGVVVWLSEIE